MNTTVVGEGEALLLSLKSTKVKSMLTPYIRFLDNSVFLFSSYPPTPTPPPLGAARFIKDPFYLNSLVFQTFTTSLHVCVLYF